MLAVVSPVPSGSIALKNNCAQDSGHYSTLFQFPCHRHKPNR